MARGALTDSDVDLFVEFEPGAITFDHFMGLSFFCEDLFGRRVEIVTPDSLSPYLDPRILEEVEFEGDRKATHAFTRDSFEASVIATYMYLDRWGT